MICQTITQPATFCVFIADEPELINASSRDYGFDFDEDEIGRELLALLPTSISMQSIPEVGTDEFEQTFLTFLS